MATVRLPRRLFLRRTAAGASGVTIGLPLLEEMMVSSAVASPTAEVPMRAFNVFFGLGIPAPLQREGYAGVLEPLGPLREKLAILRGVDQTRCDESGINAHFDGASGAFTAEPPDGEAKSGGPSIDQVIRRSVHGNAMPAGMVPTLVAGTYFRRSRLSRYVHSYNPDGTAAATMQERPRDVFDRVFGSLGDVAGDPGDADAIRRRRLRRSVLDAVVDQYKFYTGARSPLGRLSRARVADHLERIREYEQRAFANRRRGEEDGPESDQPPMPPRSRLAHGGSADPGGEGIDITIDELSEEWRLMADLYALAVELDRVRFGSLTFLAAGERLRVTGDYRYEGRPIYKFDDAKELGKSGSAGCSHEWWHQFNEKKGNEQLRAHAHFKMREVAYFLSRLDAIRETNGRSVLENSMITVSTESGDGRHNDVKRELSGVFHAVSGAGGRFKTDVITDVDCEGVDLYNTMLGTFGVDGRLGRGRPRSATIDSILA